MFRTFESRWESQRVSSFKKWIYFKGPAHSFLSLEWRRKPSLMPALAATLSWNNVTFSDPRNEHWKGSQSGGRRTAFWPWLSHALCATQGSAGLHRPGGEEGLPPSLRVSSRSNVLWVSGVICVHTVQPAVAHGGDLCLTCPPWLIVSCHLLPSVCHRSPGAPVWYQAPEMLTLGIVYTNRWGGLIRKGKEVCGSSQGLGAEGEISVCVATQERLSSSLRRGPPLLRALWAAGSERQSPTGPSVFISLSFTGPERGTLSQQPKGQWIKTESPTGISTLLNS